MLGVSPQLIMQLARPCQGSFWSGMHVSHSPPGGRRSSSPPQLSSTAFWSSAFSTRSSSNFSHCLPSGLYTVARAGGEEGRQKQVPAYTCRMEQQLHWWWWWWGLSVHLMCAARGHSKLTANAGQAINQTAREFQVEN